jgi:two-component system nitrogen regulation response regulator GlnG/two-component system response regulator HydG
VAHDPSTLDGSDGERRSTAPRDGRIALVVAWCAHEPERVGEIVRLGRGGRGKLGRGGEGGVDRARLVRRRPGGDEERPALSDPQLSRDQLELVEDGDAWVVRNLGRRKARLDDRPIGEGRAGVGATLEIEDRLLLVAVRDEALSTDPELHPFGEPDADGFVGESPGAWALRAQVRLVGPRPRHVLVLGESGSGKELVARALHRRSPRARRALVSRSAATLPEGLIDAELFGNVRGYPNPQMVERAGLVGEADGSTLFLDEIGELPESLQAHLLRLLDRGEYQRLGEARVRAADLRVVAATNRDPDGLKHDLAARFVLRVRVPPLRERREDVPVLARFLLRRIAREDRDLADRILDDRGEPRVSLGLVARLLAHPLPTNTRQLEQLLWDAIVATPPGDPLAATGIAPAPARPAREFDEVGADEVREALERAGGNRERAWRELGLRDRYVLRRLMRKFGLDR